MKMFFRAELYLLETLLLAGPGMPQQKPPPSLYNATLSKTRLWLMDIACNIYKQFGDYDGFHCQKAVTHINIHITSSVPAHIIDDLYNSSEILEKSHFSCIDNQTFDKRIVLSSYINNNMKVLTAHKIVNDIFWKVTLPSLSNLSRLNLNKVCTDEILEVVGRHCLNLEFVNIVSKSCHTRTKDRHNALKLQLCVSDVGLNCLCNCKQLKEIQMTSIIRKGCGGRQITNVGIKKLLVSLPKLCRINYTDTGILLDSIIDVERLSLISVTDYHPCAARIPKFEMLCPYLTELHLTYAFSSEDYRSEVISALSSSGLSISVLSLTNFQFDDCLKRFLELKGNHLRAFTFVSSFISISLNELFRILGSTCPILEYMNMHFYINDRSCVFNPCPIISFPAIDDKVFTNLKSLIIKGVYWDANFVLPLLLQNAVYLKRVVLNNHNYSGCLDNVFHYIQQSNPFLNLETIHFLKGANITFQFLRNFFFACPVLKTIIIESESRSYVELVDQFREELLARNVDVNINVYSVQ